MTGLEFMNLGMNEMVKYIESLPPFFEHDWIYFLGLRRVRKKWGRSGRVIKFPVSIGLCEASNMPGWCTSYHFKLDSKKRNDTLDIWCDSDINGRNVKRIVRRDNEGKVIDEI